MATKSTTGKSAPKRRTASKKPSSSKANTEKATRTRRAKAVVVPAEVIVDAVLEAPADVTPAESPASPSEKTDVDLEGIAKFTQLRVDAQKLAQKMGDRKRPMEIGLEEAEREFRGLIERAIDGKNIHVAKEEEVALVKATEGERPQSLITFEDAIYYSPSFIKSVKVRELVNALGFISRRISHTEKSQSIENAVARLEAVSTGEELANATVFFVRNDVISAATPQVLRETRAKGREKTLIFSPPKFFTAPWRIVEAFRAAQERVKTQAPLPQPTDRRVDHDAEWERLRSEAKLSPKDLFPEVQTEGLCVFDAVSLNGNPLGPIAVLKSSSGFTIVKARPSMLRQSEGQIFAFGSGEIPPILIQFIERAAGAKSVRSAGQPARPASIPAASKPAVDTAEVPASKSGPRRPAQKKIGTRRSADEDSGKPKGKSRRAEPTVKAGLTEFEGDDEEDVPRHIQNMRVLEEAQVRILADASSDAESGDTSTE